MAQNEQRYGGRQGDSSGRQGNQRDRQPARPPGPPAGHGGGDRFHNPYTFVPTPDRAGIPAGCFAGDHDPLCTQEDHSRLWPGRYSGTLHLKMTTVTPVFISKTPEVHEEVNGHKTYECVDEIPATAVKGMLRSAYEAITNSRYGVFNKEQHDRRLGLRLAAEAGAVPARVFRKNDGRLYLKLFCGESLIGRNGKPVFSRGQTAPQYAAWIPAYVQPQSLPLGSNLSHGTEVSARIVLCDHGRFQFWRVVAMAPVGQRPTPPRQLPTPGQRWGYVRENGQEVYEDVKGYVVRSGKLIQNKHDERLFFNIDPNDVEPDVPIPATVETEYNFLLADYREIHADGAFPPIGTRVEHGQHITENKVLHEGDFVYASFTNAEDVRRRILAKIFPVQISRDLHGMCPWDCLSQSLRPAEGFDHLSPADRLFGWVHQKSTGAWRGKARVGATAMCRADGQDPVERFPHGQTLPMAILGAPKPAQARFYLGDRSGMAQSDGMGKRNAGYLQDKTLRGRKIYWRPRMVANAGRDTEDYWHSPWDNHTNRPIHGYWQEYRQLPGDDERTKQNRSITGWIRPGTEIRFKLRVENLAPEELGGLLQLASLQEWAGDGATLRLGMGKPLGMGCVRLELDGEMAVAVGSTDQWIGYFSNLNAQSPSFFLDETDQRNLKKIFGTALIMAYGAANAVDWKSLPFVNAFRAAAFGPQDDCPVHYPRRTANRNSPSYGWFVENDTRRDGRTPGFSLPNAVQDSGLPYNP